MPEGPEVRSLVDKLNRHLKNKSIKKINILGGRYMRHKNLKNLEDVKYPLKIKDIKCHGKFIYWTFVCYPYSFVKVILFSSQLIHDFDSFLFLI